MELTIPTNLPQEVTQYGPAAVFVLMATQWLKSRISGTKWETWVPSVPIVLSILWSIMFFQGDGDVMARVQHGALMGVAIAQVYKQGRELAKARTGGGPAA